MEIEVGWARGEHGADSPPTGRTRVSRDNADDGRGRILIIDDEPGIVQVIRRCLSVEGFRVEAADDGVTGLAKAVAQGHDLVLLDLALPGVEGIEVLRRLREVKPSQPVVMISSTADHTLRQDCLQLGATFLAKPFTLDELLTAVRSGLTCATE
jgi:DNA-binding response OmpR family regulator